MDKIKELELDKINFYNEKDYIIENGIKYVQYEGSYFDDTGKEVEVTDGKVTLKFAEQRAIKELNELLKDCNSFDDVVNFIDNYQDDTVFVYEEGNQARIYTCWAMIMYDKEMESILWDVRAY